jgi:hypothetical protein
MGEGSREAAAAGVRKSGLVQAAPSPSEQVCFLGRTDLNEGHAPLGSRPSPLLPLNPPASSAWIDRAVGTVGIASAIPIIEGLGGIRTSVGHRD